MSFLKEYTLLGELGTGGFAKVYKVRHNTLGYIRAVRVLTEPVTDENSRAYQKFLRECKVLLRLGNGNHRNIVHIYQPRLLENHALVEMDYVDGKDISHHLTENGRFLPIDEVLRMVEEISSALAYCHQDIYKFCMDPDEDQLECDPVDGSKWIIDESTKKRLVEKYKVIHNDIHSGNIMRREDGSCVLLDFGLAITGGDDVRNSSRHANGAVEFKAPEKWDDEGILTEQSDIYSFGVVMYEYLAGRVPFPYNKAYSQAEATFKLSKAHKEQKPSPISELRKAYFEAKYPGQTYEKDYPDWLEATIMRCLEKDPDKRFRNGKELYEYIVFNIQNTVDAKEPVQGLTEEIASLKEEKQVLENQLEQACQEKKELEAKNEKYKAEIGKNEKEGKNKPLPIVLCAVFAIASAVLGYLCLNSKGGSAVPRNDQPVVSRDTTLKMENDSLKSEIKKLESEKKSLEDQIASLNKTITDLEKAQSELSIRVVELENDLEQANTDKSDLEQQIKDLTAEINKLKKPNQTPSAREKELEEIVKTLITERDAQKKRADEYEKYLDQVINKKN